MANIKVKRSAVPGKIPLTTDLELGEFAVNTYDGKVYIKKNVSGVESVEAINASVLQNLQNRYSYVVSGSSQATFSAQYVVPYVDVYLNGVRLASSDYVATNGTSVVLNTAAQVGDVVEIVALNSYTANSDFLNVPGGIATADYLKFDTTATNTPEVAKLNWNDDDGTLEVGLKGGQVVLQLGQEQVQRIYNNTGSTLVSGQVVYVTGSQGNRLTVALASASGESTSTRTFGVVTETILNEAEGFIATSGLVRGLDTSSFAEGSVLWLGTSAGTYTTTKPAAPNHGVLVGFVVRQHASVGSVFVHIANGYELNELHDVSINSPTNNQGLVYNSTTDLWYNSDFKTVDGNSILGTGDIDLSNYLDKSGGVMTGDITFSATQTFPSAGLSYVYKTANYTTKDKEGVLADTTSAAFTVTLPATPSVGAQVVIADAGANWGTNNLTIGRNGSTISGLAEDLVCNISGAQVQFIYDGSTWEIYAQVGGNGGTAVTLNGAQVLTNKDLTSSTNTFPTTLATTGKAIAIAIVFGG